MISNSEFDQSLREVEGMSDEELYESLKATGKEIGPIVGKSFVSVGVCGTW